MSKLPTHVTFVVGLQAGVERSLCVEASSVSRLDTFKRRSSDLRTVMQPLGLDHRGRRMGEDRLRVLKRQLYRHLRQASVDQTRRDDLVFELLQVVCMEYGLQLYELLDHRTRKSSIKMARRRAAVQMHERLALSEKEIADFLKIKSAHIVGNWLISSKKSERASMGDESCRLQSGIIQRNFSQATSSSSG
ncbi:hypothetical protein [uncultured Methylobacterium sp.]|jgi:hypothetical protein|uniref:hypothetical protein n=1 Tax=uncultured Methylobacterium sp. TaxID=157278 RepID=UPI00261FD0C3|nr:hypothetical protein [uncultured Methylobacterium sp.]